MNTQISSKIAVLCVALMINGLMMGGIAFLFSTQLHQNLAVALAAA